MKKDFENIPKRDPDQELKDLLSSANRPVTTTEWPGSNPSKKEFTYYTDNRKTILTSGTFAI